MELLSGNKAIIFAGPSGTGKSTVAKHILEQFPETSFSISATNRKQRVGEVHGEHYYFLDSVEAFKQKIANDEFLEWEEVYEGGFYGSLHVEIERLWKEGKVVVFDVDVEGALRIKRKLGNHALAIFVHPPSIEVLEARLRGRASGESEEELQKRIRKAEHELTYADKFDAILVNGKLEESLPMADQLIHDFLKA